MEKEKQIGIGHIIGELLTILMDKNIITQEDLAKERQRTLDQWDEMKELKSEEVKDPFAVD